MKIVCVFKSEKKIFNVFGWFRFIICLQTNSRQGWKHINIRRWMQTSRVSSTFTCQRRDPVKFFSKWMRTKQRKPNCCLYLVVHGFLLADQLGAQDQHLLLADFQLLAGGVKLFQEHLVSRWARGTSACGCITEKTPPHLFQVVFQLLVLRLQLLALRGERSEGFSQNYKGKTCFNLLYKKRNQWRLGHTYLQGLVLQLSPTSLKHQRKHEGLLHPNVTFIHFCSVAIIFHVDDFDLSHIFFTIIIMRLKEALF